MSKKEKKGGILSIFFTAEVFGMALALLCVLGLVCLATGDLLFGNIGVTVSSFFLGVFGYYAFPVLIAFTYLGIKMLIGFKLENETVKRVIKYLVIYALLAGLIVQTALTPVSLPFGEYISYCYNGGLSLSNSTFGGVLLGVIANPVTTLLTAGGAYVIYALLLTLTTIILLRSQISALVANAKENPAEKKKKEPKKSKKKEETTEEVFENEDQTEEENTFKPQRTVIFGGGDFEFADGKNKKKGEPSKPVQVLFDNTAFASSSSKEDSPIPTTTSYRERYDQDIASKTEYVKRPYESSGRTVVSPMGSRGEDNTTTYNAGRSDQMDIDLSEPEKEIYVFNRDGRSRENIAPFDRASGERNNSASTDEYNKDRFSSRVSSFDSNEEDTRGREDYIRGERNDFGSREREEYTRGERSDFSSRGSEEYTRGERSDFGSRGREDYTRGERNDFGSRGREDYTRGERSDFGSRGREDYTRGERSDFGSRGREDYTRGERSDFGSRGREDYTRGETSNFGSRGREDNTDSSRQDFGTRNANTSSETEDYSSYKSTGENPITRALRESEQSQSSRQKERTSVESETERSNSYYPPQREEEQPDYNGDGEMFGGSYFDAQDRSKKKPVIHRDRSHYVADEPTIKGDAESENKVKPTQTPQTNGSSGSSSSSSSATYEKQMSMAGIPEENKLVNPIDNIPKNYKYAFPPINLLNDYVLDEKVRLENEKEQSARASTIIRTLKNGNIDAEIVDIKYGPAITRFEIAIPQTVSIKRIKEKEEDLNLWIAAKDKIRLVAPIQGTPYIGIEVPNSAPATVGVKGLIESKEFKTVKKTSLSFCLGKDIVGRPVILDISKMPHLLVAGATGTGKSVFLNTLLISLIYKYSPEELRIILVDPKVVEFSLFRGIPNLMFNEIFTDTAKVCSMLEWAVQEMESRYQVLQAALTKNIDEYNSYMEQTKGKKMPKILIIIDEFADLMNSSNERKLMENKISRLAAKARAAGIHLIMATQRPSADIMEGSIKTNFTSRIAFKMASPTDAMVIMGEAGADKLLGRGDVLFRTSSMPVAERAQGCFVDTPEIDAVCKYLKENNKCYYDEFALEKILKGAQNEENAVMATESSSGGDTSPAKSDDELIKKAMRIAILTGNISISGLQRKLEIGFPKAGRLVDMLVNKGYISESMDNKSRKIFMTKEEFEETFGEPL